jgi:hypothetical protein
MAHLADSVAEVMSMSEHNANAREAENAAITTLCEALQKAEFQATEHKKEFERAKRWLTQAECDVVQLREALAALGSL